MAVEFCSTIVNDMSSSSEILSKKQQEHLYELRKELIISKEKMLQIISSLHSEMKKGLESKGNTLLMVPSFITERSTGLEQGNFLALDFGGSNCRICMVQLKGNGQLTVEQECFKFSKTQMHEEGKYLFGYLSDFIGNFIESYEKSTLRKLPKPINLGFTFSFPVDQSNIAKGTLVKWTKGFESQDVVGKDVVQILQECFDSRGILVKVNALINDTVGTLLASGYTEPNTLMGLILGTGTNAAYYEKTKNIPKLPEHFEKYDEMIINMEWGNFDSDKKVLPLTVYDEELDQLTWNPNQQIFEKTISGYYIGELFRIIVYRFIEKGLILRPEYAANFSEPETLDAPMLSQIVADSSQDLSQTRAVIENICHIAQDIITAADLFMIKSIGTLVGFRAASLAATGVSAVVLKRQDLLDNDETKGITVGVDGSVYEKFPFFDKWLSENMFLILGEDKAEKIKFKIARDGSGIGAALTSMIASSSQ